MHRKASKRPNPVPRVLLILLIFALPLVLIPWVLGGLTAPEPAPRSDPREELNRTLAQQGVVLSDRSGALDDAAPVEVAGQSVTAPLAVAPALESKQKTMD
jgi:hypothetical protein